MSADVATQRTIPSLLRTRAERQGGAVFVYDDAGTLTWHEAWTRARQRSAGFAALGIRRQDTVGIMLPNSRAFLEAWFGLSVGGRIEVPINPDERGSRLAHILNDSGCRDLVVVAESIPAIEAVAGDLSDLERLIVVGEGSSDRFETVPFESVIDSADRAPDVEVRFSDPDAIMYTSGSTGPAKGVVVSHGQHYVNGEQPTLLLGIDDSDTLFVPLPLHHNMAQGYGVCASLVSGAAIGIPRRFEADTFWDDVRAHRATVLSFVGAMLVLLAKREPRRDDADNPLRVGFGVPIPAELHQAFERRFGLKLIHCYGSTEATIVAWNVRENQRVGAAGPPIPGYDVAILGEDEIPVPAGESGQICIRPAEPYSMFTEYYRDRERTEAAWRNGWFHSGDCGFLDEEGNLWFTGRMGDVVRRMGEFINAHEIEDTLIAHPDVQLAAAYGVPSELTEEDLMVAIVPREGALVDAAEIRRWCKEHLARHFVPRYVDFMKELPMTATGKIEKYKLRDRGVSPTTDDARARQEAVL